MSYFDPYVSKHEENVVFRPLFFSKIWLNVLYRPLFLAPCSISSQRVVLSIPIRNPTENQPPSAPTPGFRCNKNTWHVDLDYIFYSLQSIWLLL